MRARSHGWSLVELLVVLSVIALLVGVLLPVLGETRDAAKRAACLVNLRSLGQATAVYLSESEGYLLETSHSTGLSWGEVLRRYNEDILLRSPIDPSPHFEGGQPINGKYRVTSYSINRYLAPDFIAGAKYVDQVLRPSATVHTGIKRFFQITSGDESPIWDHLHADQWVPVPPFTTAREQASQEMQINAYVGELRRDDAVSGYGYLDGHAAAEPFRDVYVDGTTNRFDYRVAQ